MIASSRGDLGALRQLGDPAEQVQPDPDDRHAQHPGGQAVPELVGQHAGPEQRRRARRRPRRPAAVLVPGTTWEMTGTPSAAMTATDSTQDGATTIGTPPIRPSRKPRVGVPGAPRSPGAGGDSPPKGSGRYDTPQCDATGRRVTHGRLSVA